MAESSSDGTLGMTRTWRYTITPDEFRYFRDHSLFQVNMDTWYYSEWADPNHFASLGRLALGDGPLTAAQGVAAFVVRQVAAFLDAQVSAYMLKRLAGEQVQPAFHYRRAA